MDAPRQRWFACLILAAAALLFFGRLGDRSVTSEEIRWAQIAREMLQTGDYFHPTINGRVYYDKPLGSYWLIVAASYLTGGVTETAARLPAAIAGWLGVWLTMSLGRRLYDARTGLLAGAILATSFGFVFYARRATADAETVTGVLAAVWLYARNPRPGPWLIGLWLIMAATSLTKGLLGFALPVSVFVAHAAWSGRLEENSWRGLFRQRWLFKRWSLAALPLAGTLFLTPFVISLMRSGSSVGLELLVRENVRRFFSPHNHTGPVHLYAEVVFLLLAPWSLFLPAALLHRRVHAPGSPTVDLAHVYFWVIFAFFTASASRRNYYLLPIVPAGSLLVARLLMADQVSQWVRRLRTAGQWLFVAVTVMAGVLLLSPADVLPQPWDSLPPLPARGMFAVGWIVLVAAFLNPLPLPPVLRGERVGVRGDSDPRGVFIPRSAAMQPPRGTAPSPPTPLPRSTGGAGGQTTLRLTATFASAFAGLAYLFLLAIPAFNDGAHRHAFVAEVRERVDFDTLALFHARDVAFDLAAPGPVPEYRDAESLRRDLQSNAIVWIIARRREVRHDALPARIVAEEASLPWEREEQSGDRLVLLRAYD